MPKKREDPRNHPIRQVLDAAATGHSPTKSELDEIGELAGDPTARSALLRAVREAASDIVAARAGGMNGEARRLAQTAAASIIEPLPEYEPPQQELPSDPGALAALIPR
jgi:hypothetical protein